MFAATWPAAPPGQRRLLIHAGLHKTGSTALQAFLAQAQGALAARGVLYPGACRPNALPGHHAAAWALSGDRRWRAAQGGLDDLAAEIGGFAGDAILSSEDFANLLGAPATLLPLLSHPRLQTHAVTVLVSLREQAGFAESLFMEMLDHGMADEAARLADTILTLGHVRFREWSFHFDYAALLPGLAALPGITVALRGYSASGGSTVADFLEFTGLSGFVVPEERVHQRAALGVSIGRFCAQRLGLSWPPPWLIEAADRLARGRPAVLSPALRAALQDRFAQGNRRVAESAGLDPAALAIRTAVPAEALALDRLFGRTLQAAALSGEPALAEVFARAEIGPQG